MSGVNGNRLEELTRQFNAPQTEFTVPAAFKRTCGELIDPTLLPGITGWFSEPGRGRTRMAACAGG